MKKKTFIILILPVLAIVAGYFLKEAFATSNPHSWDNGLVGYWNFDGQNTTSTGTRDMSANNNWGELKNGVKPTAGIVGQALSFDGSDDYIDAGNAILSTGAATIEMWTKPKITQIKGLAGLNIGVGMIIYTESTAANDCAMFGFRGEHEIHSPANSVSIGSWNHLVFVYDGNDDDLVTSYKIFINGIEQSITRLAGVIGGSTTGNYIGAEEGGGANFNGSIDEVRVYNRALSSDEVMQHYKQTRRNIQIDTFITKELISYWKMADNEGNITVIDEMGANNGTFTDATGDPNTNAHSVAGQRGRALDFDGVNDYIVVGDTGLVQEEGTILLWINSESYDANYRNVFTTNDAGSNDAIRMEVRTASSPGITMYDETMSIQYFSAIPGQWEFMAVVWNSTNMIGYTNTVQDFNVARDTTVTMNNFVFGRGFNTVRFFNGLIDDVHIYDRALSVSEIKAMYQYGLRQEVGNLRIATANPHDWSNGLVGYWDFNGQNTTSTGTRDMSVNDNWGELKNGVIPRAGVVGQALSFDGVNDYVNVPNLTNYSFPAQGTFETWLYLNTWDDYDNIGFAGHNTNAFRLERGGGWGTTKTDAIRVSVHDAIGTQPYVNFDTELSLNTWYHVVTTWDTSQNYVWCYLDGSADGGGEITTWPTVFTNVKFGTAYSGRYFDGLIDEVRIYNRALSADEIKQHYEQSRRNLRL